MSLTKKEIDLFDALRDVEGFSNFLLMEIRGRPVILADHSEEEDGSDLQPLYVRVSDIEAQKIIEDLDGDGSEAGEDGDDEEENEPRRTSKKPKRWKG